MKDHTKKPIYNVAYKTTHNETPLHISFDAVYECIEKHGRNQYLPLFEITFVKIKYVTRLKSFRCLLLGLHENDG